MTTEAWSPLGRALLDFASGDRTAAVQVRIEQGKPAALAMHEFFRAGAAFPMVERVALATPGRPTRSPWGSPAGPTKATPWRSPRAAWCRP